MIFSPAANGNVAMKCLLLSAFICGAIHLQAQDPKADASLNRATVPVPRFQSANWTKRHASFVEQAKGGGIDLLFLGDSLTANWEKYPALWEKKFGACKAAQFGIGGDQTEHLLWRLQNGELDSIRPKLIVLLIGTNNMSQSLKYTPEMIAEGVGADLAEIRRRIPDTKIVLVSIPPRVAPMNEWLNTKNIAVNKLLPALADGEHIRYLDIWPLLLKPDGTTDETCYADATHFSEKGYIRYADALQPKIEEILDAPSAAKP